MINTRLYYFSKILQIVLLRPRCVGSVSRGVEGGGQTGGKCSLSKNDTGPAYPITAVCVFRPLSVATRCLRTTNDGHLWFRFYVMPLVWSVCSILFSLSCQRALVPTGAKWNFLARINTHRKGSKGRQRRKTKKRQRTHNHDSPPDLPLCRDCLPLSGRSLYELLGY